MKRPTIGSLLLLACAAAGCGDDSASRPQPAESLTFPEGFLFGTAIAGFQVDMGCPTLPAASCVDPASDWYAFTTSPETIASPKAYLSGQDPGKVGPGHWELFEKDLDLAQNELKNNALRFSIEWSRVFPEATDGVEGYDALKAKASEAALAHYHDELAALKQRGMTPLVTLNHYTLPTWIHDAVGCHKDLAKCSPRGWLDKDRTLKEIAKFAGFVAKEFGGEVDQWITLNEPFAVMFPGYVFPSATRSNPPAVSLAFAEAKQVFVALIEAHARMYDAVKANDAVDADGDGNSSAVGVVYSMVPAIPADPTNPLDVKGAQNLFYLYNMAYLNGVAKGDIDPDLSGKPVHRDDLANRMDFIGVNYYNRATVQGTTDPFLPDMSALSTFNPLTLKIDEIYPRGLYEMVKLVHDEFHLPTLITENGRDLANVDGETGEGFLVEHLAWASRATQDGLGLRGYFYWSLMDNYEWNHGMGMRFGLYAVDPNDPEKTRVARKSAETYGHIAEGRTIPAELMVAYPAPR
jgi:beta-glucosidase/6-phospho-beta-glucosidase/beta-galactosidase